MKALFKTRLFVIAFAVTLLGGILFACSQTPTSVPIRTFERAQRVDTICLRVVGDNIPEPVPQNECAPVPAGSDQGGALVNQLFALVTQSARGEVAVVDLSSSTIVDRSHATPGINFLPVGAIPTDIAATPDGRMAFVAAAEPNKFAIYGIAGHRILGDALNRLDPEGAVTLGSWPVCSLPQRPGSLAMVSRGTGLAQYELVAVLPGDRSNSAKIITIDPLPFLRADRRKIYTGPNAGQNADNFPDGPTLTPGVLQPCPITAAIDISGDTAVPSSFVPGPRWDDGVKYVDGGVDLTCAQPDPSSRCGTRPCGCSPDIVQADGGAPIPTDGGLIEPTCATGDAGTDDGGTTATDAGTGTDAGADAGAVPLDFGPLDPPQPVAVALDDQTLYVADNSLPLIHVIDLSTAGSPRELPPLTMTSVSDPSRISPVRDLSISPATREFKRFLYAVDSKDGTIAIFDITDPNTTTRVPMRRPHAELNPFQPEDRLGFGAPVVAVAFAKHDFPLTRENGISIPNAPSGLLCNPNPHNDPKTNPGDWGVGYRYNSTDVDVTLQNAPNRLRGIFAFVTLSNGQTVVVDVDDWDAPCRRPATLTTTAQTTVTAGLAPDVLAAPQVDIADNDPYHAPTPDPATVTLEDFYPVSSPHRIRSMYLLRDDLTTGKHIPYTPSTPQITSPGAPLPLFGQGSEKTPHLRPTAPAPGVSAGTEDVGILFATDAPDTQFDQDWNVQYEGPLPGFTGFPSPLVTTDGFQTMNVNNPNAHFCAKGVEDWQISGERANLITTALAQSGRNGYPERLDRRMADYVQVQDDLLPGIDQYWPLGEADDGQQCWDPSLDTAAKRYDQCLGEFGTFAQQNESRDFPILEAYDDHLVIGTFATIKPNKTREIISQSTYNQDRLKLLRCCFHHQINFQVRAASQWVTTGSTLGFMSHMTTDEKTNRCIPSCVPRDQLLNSRAPSLPYGGESDFAPFRDTPLAMRNPSFSFFVQNGYVIDTTTTTDPATGKQVNSPTFGQQIDFLPQRDTFYHFQSRGQFTPLIVDLTQGNAANTVDPQSMRFIDTLGQVAVVDGSNQGLILIDLSLVAIVKGPYF